MVSPRSSDAGERIVIARLREQDGMRWLRCIAQHGTKKEEWRLLPLCSRNRNVPDMCGIFAFASASLSITTPRLVQHLLQHPRNPIRIRHPPSPRRLTNLILNPTSDFPIPPPPNTATLAK